MIQKVRVLPIFIPKYLMNEVVILILRPNSAMGNGGDCRPNSNISLFSILTR